MTADLDDLEAISAAMAFGPRSFDSPQSRSRKFQLAHKDGLSRLAERSRKRPKWKKELAVDRAHAAAGHRRGGK